MLALEDVVNCKLTVRQGIVILHTSSEAWGLLFRTIHSLRCGG